MRKITVPTIVTNGHFNKEKTLEEIKRCGADRVAIAIDRESGYRFSSPESLKIIKELIEYYESNGIEGIGKKESGIQKGLTDTANYYFPEEGVYTRIL